jgi:hypothetical protein
MYGSITNRIAETTGVPEIQVGDGVTALLWSDSYPYTVTELIHFKTGNRKGQIKGFIAQEDHAEPDKENGHDYFGNQVYKYSPNPNGRKAIVTLRKNGKWVDEGGTAFGLGFRRKYQDPSF